MTTRFEITVKFESREDGGLRVSSPDVPLFILSGNDPKAVLANVKPALEIMLADMLKADRVQIERLVPFSEREHPEMLEPCMMPSGDLSYCVAA